MFDLFRKKKESPSSTFHASSNSLNETIEHDGFIIYGETKKESESPPAANKNKVLKSQMSLIRTIEEIPFQFSPTYISAWTSGSSKRPVKIKQIDWDNLQYDFTLEKSIVHS